MRWSISLAAVCLVAAFPGAAAFAQDAPAAEPGSIALNQFDPTPAGDAFFGVPSPYVHGQLFVPRVALVFDAAEKPLVLVDDADSGSVVGRQTFMHVSASAAIVDRLLISATFPVALLQGGESPTIQGVTVRSPDSSQAGDLRLGLRVRLFGEVESPFQIGAGAYLFTPTGASDLEDGAAAAYVGEGSARVYPYASFGGRFDALIPWLWTVSGGAMIRSSDNPSAVGYGVGFAALVLDDVLQIGPELRGSTPVQSTLNFKATPDDSIELESKTNLELMLGLRMRVWRFRASMAGGPGLTKAVGTPAYRLLWGFAYDPEPEGSVAEVGGRDTDQDGITDEQDSCPYAHGPADADDKKHGCPVIDDDEDGVPNPDDACPLEHGVPNQDTTKHGCPPRAAAGG